MARRVTQMRLFGTVESTSVHADRQGPSITTRSPEARTCANRSRNGPTSPPGLARMRTSAEAGEARAVISRAAARIFRMLASLFAMMAKIERGNRALCDPDGAALLQRCSAEPGPY